MSISPYAHPAWSNLPLEQLLAIGFQAYNQEGASSETTAAAITRACSAPPVVPPTALLAARCIMKRHLKKETESTQKHIEKAFRQRIPTPPTTLKERTSFPLECSDTPKPSASSFSSNSSLQKADKTTVCRLLPVACDDDLSEPETEIKN